MAGSLTKPTLQLLPTKISSLPQVTYLFNFCLENASHRVNSLRNGITQRKHTPVKIVYGGHGCLVSQYDYIGSEEFPAYQRRQCPLEFMSMLSITISPEIWEVIWTPSAGTHSLEACKITSTLPCTNYPGLRHCRIWDIIGADHGR